MRIVVVFPAPFGPRYPTTRPAGTESSSPSSATTSPKRFVSPRQRMATSVMRDGTYPEL